MLTQKRLNPQGAALLLKLRAILALGDRGKEAFDVAEIEKALDFGDWDIRILAAQVLTANHSTARNYLGEVLFEAQNPECRKQAANLLTGCDDPNVERRLTNAVLNDPSDVVRAVAVNALLKDKTVLSDVVCVAMITALLNSPKYPLACARALSGLHLYCERGDALLYAALLTHSDYPQVAKAAQSALQWLVQLEKGRKLLEEMCAKHYDPRCRTAAAEALSCCAHPDTVMVLLGRIDEDSDPEVRATAVESLVVAVLSDDLQTPVAEKLLYLLKNEPDASVRLAAVKALKGADNPWILQAQIEALGDFDTDVGAELMDNLNMFRDFLEADLMKLIRK